MNAATLQPVKAESVTPLDSNAAIKSLCDFVGDDVDDIQCSTSIIRDLLRLAIQELQRAQGSRAASAIRAAERYVGDIEATAAHLSAVERAALEGVAA